MLFGLAPREVLGEAECNNMRHGVECSVDSVKALLGHKG